MITTLYIKVMLAMIKGFFYFIPNVPQTPQAVVDGGEWIITTIVGITSVLRVIYTPELLNGMIAVILVVMNFERIYYIFMWIVRKLPISVN